MYSRVGKARGRKKIRWARASRGSATPAVVAASIMLAVPLAYLALRGWSPEADLGLRTAEVVRGKLPVTVTASGTLQCQLSTEIKCAVHNLGRDDGTQILYLIPNGTPVHQGDLLVQLDASRVQERLDYYLLQRVRHRAKQLQANARLENQKLANITRLAEAKQAVQLAQLALDEYEQGIAKIDRDELTSQVQMARNQVKLAQAEAQLREDELRGVQMLSDAGYRGQAQLNLARLQYLRAAYAIQSAKNQLTGMLARLRKFDRFEDHLTRKKLEADLRSAQAQLRQVTFENKWLLAEREADKHERDESVARYDERIERYTRQVENCWIYAPHDGIVVYERDPYGGLVSEGGTVRLRQTILRLPNTSLMQVRTLVNESQYRYLRPGLRAAVHVEALPERTYAGTVKSVAAVPSQAERYSQDVRAFEVLVTLDGRVRQLRPGMTGVVEIDVENEQEVLQVPVGAIFELDGQLYVYVNSPEGPQRRPVTIGESNEQMAEVRSGLELGEHVVLHPELVNSPARGGGRCSNFLPAWPHHLGGGVSGT